MLKILFNEKSDADNKINIILQSLSIKVEVEDKKRSKVGFDIISSLLPYSSYALCCSSGKTKIYRKIHKTDYKFLELNRLGVAIKMDFARIIQLFSDYGILQVDTGIVSNQERDIIIRVFEGKPENTTINADEEYEIGYFNSDELSWKEHPRDSLWDSYSLSYNDTEWKSNRKGVFDQNPDSVLISTDNDKDYVTLKIQKYKGKFEKPLNRDIDNEVVLVESSAGLVNNRRVMLKNGKGSFRLYPFGHKGMIKIKLGRKWYEVWNEYNLVVDRYD